MLITVLVVLSLTITTTIVSGNDCECEYNAARNDFHGDQECFTTYDEIQQNWNRYDFDNVTTYSDTLCNGNCGAALNRILYYTDRVYTNTRDGSSSSDPYQLVADYYCVRENSCGRITEDLRDDIVNSFSPPWVSEGACSSLQRRGVCSSSCVDIFSNLTEEYGCCTRTVIEVIRTTESGLPTSSMIFARCGISDPGPCQRIGEIGQPVSVSSFEVISYDITVLLSAVILARLFVQ